MGVKTNFTKIALFKILLVVMRILGYACLFLIIATIFSAIVPYIKNGQSFRAIRFVVSVGKFLIPYVKANLPTVFFGSDVSKLYVILGAFSLKRLVFDDLGDRFLNLTKDLKFKDEYAQFKAQKHLSEHSKALAPLQEKMEKLQANDNQSREELLRLFAETKKKLDSMVKSLAFLSIDVVGSTAMKEGEDKALIEHTFKEYKKFVTEKISQNGVLKSAWTPDGVMICFPSSDAAVKAAKDIIIGLDAFNKELKAIKTDFKVRCGVSAGNVYFDESTPMEEMSDKVIDVAGHMQKYAAHNALFIPKPSYEMLKSGQQGFVLANKVIDGYEVLVWERPVAQG